MNLQEFAARGMAAQAAADVILADALADALAAPLQVRLWRVAPGAWWKPGGRGFTKKKARAGVFDFDTACDFAASPYGETPENVIVLLEAQEIFSVEVVRRMDTQKDLFLHGGTP